MYSQPDPRSLFIRDEDLYAAHVFPDEPQPFKIPQNDNFQSHMRKASRVWWQRWCEENLSWGDEIIVTSRNDWKGIDAYDDERMTYHYVDDSHINCNTDRGVGIGIPTCFVINIVKLESWNDEWL